MTTGSLVVVTGLSAEARLARPWAGRVIAAGGDSHLLRSQLQEALSQGATAVLSFGLAGGLQPGLPPGTLVVPHEIVSGSARWPTHAGWGARLRAALPQADSGALAGVDSPVAGATDKQRLSAATGAVAADMESHVAAELALRAGRPFAALRAIADPAERSLPPAAVVGMSPGGGINLLGVFGSLLRRPAQLPELARVAIDVRTAMEALTRSCGVLGDSLHL